MADFDPYYTWLGIPPKDQPPHHYRLLAVELFEENREVIEGAANRQMAYLQELSAGDDHVDQAQRLLGEVAKARVCLLAAESKARYDSKLKEEIEAEDEDDEPQGFLPQDFGTGNDEEAAGDLPNFGTGATGGASSGPKKTTTRRRSAGRRKGTARKARTASDGESAKAASNPALKIWLPIAAGALVLLIILVLLIPSGEKGGKTTAKSRKTSANNRDASSVEIPDIGKEPPQNKKKPDKTPEAPVREEVKKSENPQTASTQEPAQKKPDTSASLETVPPDSEPELSEEENARERLQNQYELEEDAFEHTWHLANDQTRNLEAVRTSGSSGTAGGAEFEAELKRRVDAKKNEILERWKYVRNQPAGVSNALDKEYNQLQGKIFFPYNPAHMRVKDSIPEITSIRTQVEQEFASREPATANPAEVGLVKDIRARYAELAADPEVTGLLEKAGGKLAEPPPLPESTGSESTQFASTDSPPTDSVDDADPQGDPSEESKGGDKPKKPAKPQPTLSFAQLKEKLTEQEKETKKSLGRFNKKAKAYSKAKKTLSKEIKNLERTLLQATTRLDSMQEGEQKIAFGKEIEKQLSNPLKQKQKELASRPRPDSWPETKVLSESLKRLETTFQQATEKPEYSEEEHKKDAASIKAIGKKIAGYRKAFDTQTARLAQ